jgi:hypothetical protein
MLKAIDGAVYDAVAVAVLDAVDDEIEGLE